MFNDVKQSVSIPSFVSYKIQISLLGKLQVTVSSYFAICNIALSINQLIYIKQLQSTSASSVLIVVACKANKLSFKAVFHQAKFFAQTEISIVQIQKISDYFHLSACKTKENFDSVKNFRLVENRLQAELHLMATFLFSSKSFKNYNLPMRAKF